MEDIELTEEEIRAEEIEGPQEIDADDHRCRGRVRDRFCDGWLGHPGDHYRRPESVVIGR